MLRFLFCLGMFRYLNYLLLLPARRRSIDLLSLGGFVGRVLDRTSDVTCRGVFERLSTGELSLFDSVLESGRNVSTNRHNSSNGGELHNQFNYLSTILLELDKWVCSKIH